MFKREEEVKPVDFHPYNEEAANRQIAKIKRIRHQRNNELVTKLLAQIREDAIADKNLMPSIIAAVKEYATVGEIIGQLKECYGEFDEPIFF